MFAQSAFIANIPRLRVYALNLTRNVDIADDLLQSTLLRGWERQTQFEDGTNLFSWLKTIMYSIHISVARARARRPTETLDGKEIAAHPAPDEALEARESLRLLEMIAPKRRGPLLWMGFGYSHHEISEFIGIPPGTVLSRASRARAQLRREAA